MGSKYVRLTDCDRLFLPLTHLAIIRYEEDADLAKDAGFRGFRISLAWSRIYPEGEGDEPNQEGIDHYRKVLDALIDRGLEPMVTLYHWDLPQVRTSPS